MKQNQKNNHSIMDINFNNYIVKNPNNFKITNYDTSSDGYQQPEKDILNAIHNDTTTKISNLQNRLYAENKQSLLIIMQGLDSAGKDGTIKHIMTGVNPQGVAVHSFKHPSSLELSHDYLWRHYEKLPEKGQITIFNRSHYENVLISKVHPEIVLAERIPEIDSLEKIDKKFWEKRYEQINQFENMITQNGTHILKFYFHLSKGEQRKRFLDRIENKEKHWKFSSADITERQYWDDYQKAYANVFKNTSTKLNPWHIIPADDKWFTHLLIGKFILKKLEQMNPFFPPMSKEEEKLIKAAKEKLLKEK